MQVKQLISPNPLPQVKPLISPNPVLPGANTLGFPPLKPKPQIGQAPPIIPNQANTSPISKIIEIPDPLGFGSIPVSATSNQTAPAKKNNCPSTLYGCNENNATRKPSFWGGPSPKIDTKPKIGGSLIAIHDAVGTKTRYAFKGPTDSIWPSPKEDGASSIHEPTQNIKTMLGTPGMSEHKPLPSMAENSILQSLLNVKIGNFNISKVIAAYLVGYIFSGELAEVLALDMIILQFFDIEGIK